MPDFGNIISKTISVIKKSKWLLVYALVLATFSAGSGGFNFSTSSNNLPSDFNLNNLQEKLPKDMPQKTSAVLGAYSSAVMQSIQTVPVTTWIFLAGTVIVIGLLGVLVRIVVFSWAAGGLIAGFNLALAGQSVSLKNTAGYAKSTIKNLIILRIITSFLSFIIPLAIVAVGVGLFFLARTFSETLVIVWTVVGGLAGAILFIYTVIIFTMIGIYAERLVVLAKLSPWEAVKQAYSLGRKNFAATLVMGIINSVTSSVFGCLTSIATLTVCGIPAFFLVYPAIKNARFPSLAALISLVLIFLVFSAVSLILRALIVLYKYGNWNQVYDFVIKKVENK